MKISEVLRRAADEELNPFEDDYSCDAIRRAHASMASSLSCWDILLFVNRCGVDFLGNREFTEFHDIKQRQGARFQFLDLAALVAEEEGL